jgi:biotin operon repressor
MIKNYTNSGLSSSSSLKENIHRPRPRPGTLDRISQRELIELLGRSRQQIWSWTNKGMPRNPDGSYDLSSVVSWLPGYYHHLSEKEFQNTLEIMKKKIQRNVRQLERFFVP